MINLLGGAHRIAIPTHMWCEKSSVLKEPHPNQLWKNSPVIYSEISAEQNSIQTVLTRQSGSIAFSPQRTRRAQRGDSAPLARGPTLRVAPFSSGCRRRAAA